MAKPWWAKKVLGLCSALFSGEGVEIDRREARLRICMDCTNVNMHKRKSGQQIVKCGLCGCKIAGGDTSLVNLARYEETKRYGCKHAEGSQWKKHGV